jgi:hypothetical protein
MGSTFMTMEQGTTLAWTQTYGAPSTPRARARELFRDGLFAAALLGFVFGVASFVAHEHPPVQYAGAGEHRSAS